MALTTVSNTQLSDASQLNQLVNTLTGQVNNAHTLAHNSSTAYSLTVRGTGGGGLALKVTGSSNQTLLQVNDAGITLGTSITLSPTVRVTSDTNNSSAATRFEFGNPSSAVIPMSLEDQGLTNYSTLIGSIRTVALDRLYSALGSPGGHIAAMAAQQIVNSGNSISGQHHFGGLFTCNITGGTMSSTHDNSICGILAAGETSINNVTVRGANIQATNINATAGVTHMGIEVNMRGQNGVQSADRYGVTVGSTCSSATDAWTVSGNNAAYGIVKKSSGAAVFQDAILLYGSSAMGNVLSSTGSIIRDAVGTQMKYAIDVSASTFVSSNAGLFNIPGNLDVTPSGASGAAQAIPGTAIQPLAWIKVRANGTNGVFPIWPL